MSVALLDTNVLLALGWPFHQHHSAAHRWFARRSKAGWATCSLTQLGFVRLSANPSYTASAVTPAEAADLLQRWTSHEKHLFWASPRADDALIYKHALGPGQVNDAWLVATSRQNSGVVATFDTRMSVHGGREPLVEIIPS